MNTTKGVRLVRYMVGAALSIGACSMFSISAHATPDLIIESLSGVQPTYNVGEQMPNFKVHVKNIGDSAISSMPTGGSEIRVRLSDCDYKPKGDIPASSCSIDFKSSGPKVTPEIGGIDVGEVVEIRWPLTWPGTEMSHFREGTYSLTFKVESDASEVSENNNLFMYTISVAYPGIDSYAVTVEGNDYVGPCSQGIGGIVIANARITAIHGSGYVDYKWVTSHGGESSHVYSKVIKNHDTHERGIQLATKDDFKGWVALKVLSPYEHMSDRAYYEIKCTDVEFKKKLKIKPKFEVKTIPIVPK